MTVCQWPGDGNQYLKQTNEPAALGLLWMNKQEAFLIACECERFSADLCKITCKQGRFLGCVFCMRNHTAGFLNPEELLGCPHTSRLAWAQGEL